MQSFFKKPAFKKLTKQVKSYKKALSQSTKRGETKLRDFNLATFEKKGKASLQGLEKKVQQFRNNLPLFWAEFRRHAHYHWGRIMDWYENLTPKQHAILMIVIAFAVGAGIKIGTDRFYPTGYDDTQIKGKGVTLDLNAIEKQQLEKDKNPDSNQAFPICSL